jgi:hypothetical protein
MRLVSKTAMSNAYLEDKLDRLFADIETVQGSGPPARGRDAGGRGRDDSAGGPAGPPAEATATELILRGLVAP